MFPSLVTILRSRNLRLFRDAVHHLGQIEELVIPLEMFRETLAYIESGQNHEEHFAPEYPVVDVLKGITCKEHDAGAETDQKS